MEKILEIRDLVIRYGPIEAVKKVSMTIEKGQIVALLGANGAGKSTIIKCISGLVKPSMGVVMYEGKSIEKLLIHQLSGAGIICSPEGRLIFKDLTVEENLKVGAYALKTQKITTVDEHGQTIVTKVSAKQRMKENFERVYRYFPVLLERRKQTAATLSGGEQQMLAIGRALMASPKLLLLDEPSLGLAPLIVRDIFEIIKQINKDGVTVLLVEQNAQMALQIAHRGYVLETGRVTLEGPASDLLSDPKVRSAYLGLD